MKTWEIYHFKYGNICPDDYYGKETRRETIGFVTDTEENVKSLVEKLNKKNRSYYAKDCPEEEWDRYCEDEDYISYTELKINTLEEIEKRYIR